MASNVGPAKKRGRKRFSRGSSFPACADCDKVGPLQERTSENRRRRCCRNGQSASGYLDVQIVGRSDRPPVPWTKMLRRNLSLRWVPDQNEEFRTNRTTVASRLSIRLRYALGDTSLFLAPGTTGGEVALSEPVTGLREYGAQSRDDH